MVKHPSPFVKWAGGKAQLLAQFEPYFPSHFGRYIEAFAGGGAVFFHLYRQGRLRGKQVVLIDRLEELINCYRVIQTHMEELIGELRRHEPRKQDEDYFYSVRDWDRSPDYGERNEVERAARFMFLNRTCYNGLYRVNQQGQFNVPFGRYQNPTICDEDNLRAVSRALKGVTLLVGDFSHCLQVAEAGDFVYLDPPYHPISDTSSFTNYTEDDFGIEDQQRLARLFRELDHRGCQLMLSNSRTKPIQELYRSYTKKKVRATRTIGARVDTRRTITEWLIVNR
jgi:DNA adenine methylase